MCVRLALVSELAVTLFERKTKLCNFYIPWTGEELGNRSGSNPKTTFFEDSSSSPAEDRKLIHL